MYVFVCVFEWSADCLIRFIHSFICRAARSALSVVLCLVCVVGVVVRSISRNG